MRKQTKLAALVSAAALLAIGASVTSLAAPGWQADSEGEWQWFDSYGDPVYDQWKQYEGKWYYLGEDGYMYKNQVFTDEKNHTFWVDGDGVMQTGKWLNIDNSDNLDVNGDGHEEATLYMYFGSDGIAYKADPGQGVVAKKLGSLLYVFDEEGYMMNGWVIKDDNGTKTIYYCGEEDDGHARIGWKKLPIPDGHVCPDPETEQWFFFQSNGVAFVKKDGEQLINGKWYSFTEDGCVRTSWTPYSEYPGASEPPYGDTPIYNDVDGSDGFGWVNAPAPDSGSGSYWYYLVTYRDGSKTVHSIPFNYKTGKYVAKTINGKVYLFDGSDGRMVTGLTVLSEDTPDQVEWRDDPYSNDYGRFFGDTTVTELHAGIYYFEEPRNGQNSAAGQMVTGKVTYLFEEGATSSEYYFARATKKYLIQNYNAGSNKWVDSDPNDYVPVYEGRAYQNMIVDGVLYGPEGRRIQAEDGRTYSLVNLDNLRLEYAQNVYFIQGSSARDMTTVGAEHVIVVDRNGRVKTSGKVKIEDRTYNIDPVTYCASPVEQ